MAEKDHEIKGDDVTRFRKAVVTEARKFWSLHKITEDYYHLKEPKIEYSTKKNIIRNFFRDDSVSYQTQYTLEEAINKSDSKNYEECENLVETVLKSPEGTRISIVGPFGSGKTTEILRLVQDMPVYDPELVHFLSFRDIPSLKQTTPCDLLFGHLSLDNTDDLSIGYQWLLKNQSKATFVFDGLDQATWTVSDDVEVMGPYDRSSTSVILSNLLNKNLFPNVKIVYTSREHSVVDLPPTLRPDLVIGLSGFSEGDIKQLFKSFVGDDSEKLWHYFSTRSQSLIPLLTTPAFLVITAAVFKSNPTNPPKFATGVMLELLEILMCSGHITQRDYFTVMEGLGKLSFDGMKEKRVMLNEKNIESAGLTLPMIEDWLRRIPGNERLYLHLLHGDKLFSFPHLVITLEEILCSKHISSLPLEKFKKVVKEQLVNEQWSMVLRFLSGILLNKEVFFEHQNIDKNEIANIEEKKTLLKDCLALKYKNKKNTTEKISVLEAVFESNDKDFIKGLVKEINIKFRPLTSAVVHVISSVMHHCTELNEVELLGCNLSDTNGKILCNNIIDCDIKICRLNVCENTIDLELASNLGKITKHSSVDHLRMEYCSLTDSELEKFLSEAKGSELLYLNVCGNFITRPAIEQIRKSIKVEKIVDNFDIDKSHILPPRIIEIQKSMKEYGMQKDDQLTPEPILGAHGGKLMLDAEYGMQKDDQLTPEPILGAHGGKLMLDADQPTTHAYGEKSAAAEINEEFLSDQAEAAKLDEAIRECLSAPYIKGELIGPEGGSINVSDCKANYPPNAFQKKTPVRHSVRSSYDDAPEGFAVCSPELECTTFGVPFKGSVTVTLPLHIIPEDGQVVILKKKGYNSPWIQFLTCRVNEEDRTVTFQISHFCSWIATIGKILGRLMGKVYLCHYLFYKRETCQLISFTCIDNSGEKTKFVTKYAQKGFIEALPQPEQIVLNSDEYMTYRYKCVDPQRCRLIPNGKISIKRSGVEKYFYRSLYLSPKPPRATKLVVIRYFIKPPQQDVRDSVAVLQWKTQTGANVLTDAEETVAEGGIVPGRGESVQGSLLGGATAMGTTSVKQIWQGGEYNPAVLTGNEQDDGTAFAENELAEHMSAQETDTSDDASVEIELLGEATGAVGPEGNVATGENVPGGAGSLEDSLFGEAAATSAMVAGGATAVKQLWPVGGASNSADVVGSELGSGGNVLAGEAAAAQHELAETIPVQETGDDTFVDLLTEASSAGEAEGNVAAGGIVPGSSEPVVESSLGETAATGAMLTSSSTVPVEEMWPGASANIRRCGREFYEHHSGMHTYPFPLNRPKGKVKIINNKFLGQGRSEIRGTDVDIRNLETLSRNLGLLVDIEEDLSAEQMCSSCEEFAKNIGDVSSVFLIILSHGGTQNGQECIQGNDRRMVQREKIISYFTTHNCPHLTGIPKVFMFEACRGSLGEERRVRAGAESEVYVAPSSGSVDMLVVYPSQSGYVSFYDRQRGSWLIEAFTYIFSRDAYNTHVLDMLTMVNRRIADRISLRGDVQASNQENYLTKHLYLFPGINDASRPTS